MAPFRVAYTWALTRVPSQRFKYAPAGVSSSTALISGACGPLQSMMVGHLQPIPLFRSWCLIVDTYQPYSKDDESPTAKPMRGGTQFWSPSRRRARLCGAHSKEDSLEVTQRFFSLNQKWSKSSRGTKEDFGRISQSKFGPSRLA